MFTAGCAWLVIGAVILILELLDSKPVTSDRPLLFFGFGLTWIYLSGRR